MGTSLGLPTAEELGQLPPTEREKFRGASLSNTVKQTLQAAPPERVELLIQGVFGLHSKVDEQSETVKKLSIAVESREKDAIELRAHVSKLCGKVESQEKEINVLGKKVESNDQAMTRMSNALAAAERKIQAISYSACMSSDKVDQREIRFDRVLSVPSNQSSLVESDGAIASALGLPVADFKTVRRFSMGSQRKAAIIRLKDPMTISRARAHMATQHSEKSLTMRRSLTFLQRILGRFCAKLQSLLPDDRFRFSEWEGQVRVAPRAEPRAFQIYPAHLHFLTGTPSANEADWQWMTQSDVVSAINLLFGPMPPEAPNASPSGSPPHKTLRTDAGPSGC